MSDQATRWTLIAATGLVAVVIGAAAYMFAAGGKTELPKSDALVNIGATQIGGPFELTAHTGDRVTDAEIIDTPTLMYFGYTFCPDVCPIDVQVMADAVELLGEEGVTVKPVFVTVDPARDTPEALSDYAEAMHPRMIALTGSEEDIATVSQTFKVYYQKSGDGENYLLSHSNYHYLLMPGRGLVAMFRPGTSPEKMAEDTARVIDAVGTTPDG